MITTGSFLPGLLCWQVYSWHYAGSQLNKTDASTGLRTTLGACKRGQCYFSKWLWLSTAWTGPACWQGPLEHGCLPALHHPSISLWLSVHLFESVQFARCVCEVRVIQTLQQVYCFDKKASLHRNEKKKKQTKHKLLWGIVWSLKKRDIQSKCLSHCKQQYHRQAV